jgi:hypothetical protein
MHRAWIDSLTVRYRTVQGKRRDRLHNWLGVPGRLAGKSMADWPYPVGRVRAGIMTSSTRACTVRRVGGRVARMDRKMR